MSWSISPEPSRNTAPDANTQTYWLRRERLPFFLDI